MTGLNNPGTQGLNKFELILSSRSEGDRMHTDKQNIDRHSEDKQTDIQTDIQTEKEKHIQTDR